MLIQIHAIKRRLENFWLSIFKNGCYQSGDRILKLILFEESTDGIAHLCTLIQIHKNHMLIKKFLGRHDMVKKWVWPIWPWESKIDCISKMNRWNKLIFCMLIQIQES